MTSLRRVGDYLSFVKFSHTVFALPFALLGFFLGVLDRGGFAPLQLVLVVACMIFAIVLLTLFPGIALWLPNLVMGPAV